MTANDLSRTQAAPEQDCHGPANEARTPHRQYWETRYRTGPTPWDTGVTPPEVREFWSSGLLPHAGIAIDLGCGTGTNVTYLASQGLRAIGIELSYSALAVAANGLLEKKAANAGAAYLVQGDVSLLPVHNLGAAYILDIGCLNSVPRARRRAYASAVVANLAPGGYYHLYAHDATQQAPHADDNARGLGKDEVTHLFGGNLDLLTVLRGQPDPHPSRWYLLRKSSLD